MMIKKILLPADVSEKSLDALMMAFPLAAETGAVSIVLHVAGPRPTGECAAGSGCAGWTVDRIVQEAALDLQRLMEQRRNGPGLHAVRKKVLFGDVSREIIDAARSEAVDLLIIAPCPHRKVKNFFVESVTDRIVREAPCPIVLISRAIQKGKWWGSLVPSVRLFLRHAETVL